MTTGVFKGEIYVTSLHSPGPKIRDRWKQRAIIFWREPSYSQFCLKIRCHSNRGRQGKNL